MTATVQPAAVVPSASSPGYISLRSNHEQRVTGNGAGGGSGRSYYNEHEPRAAAWLRELIAAGHIAPGDVDERSIAEIKPHELDGYTQCHFFAGIGGWSLALRLAGWPDTEPVWTGSCPCQPFSAVGKRQVDKDERHLWPAFRAAIAERQPSVCFGEQVASADGRVWLAGVRADLEALGYAVGAADLCAAGVGAPQPRQRIYWGAASDTARWRGQRGGAQRDVRQVENRHWEDVEWVETSDKRKFRNQPGLRLLAHGVPDRVGYIRGFGNAIVPEVAAQFVSAFREVRLGGGGGVLVGRCAPTTEAKCNIVLSNGGFDK